MSRCICSGSIRPKNAKRKICIGVREGNRFFQAAELLEPVEVVDQECTFVVVGEMIEDGFVSDVIHLLDYRAAC